MLKNRLIIWYNPNKDIYYHKIVWGWYCNYKVGYINGYGHEVIYILDLPSYYRPSLAQRALKRLIRFLEKFERG